MLNCRSQGWGQLINLGVLMVGLLAFNGRGGAPYSHGSAGATYRFSFGCIAVLIAWMAYYRTWRMKPVAGPKVEPVKQPDKVCDPQCNPACLKFLCCVAALSKLCA